MEQWQAGNRPTNVWKIQFSDDLTQSGGAVRKIAVAMTSIIRRAMSHASCIKKTGLFLNLVLAGHRGPHCKVKERWQRWAINSKGTRTGALPGVFPCFERLGVPGGTPGRMASPGMGNEGGVAVIKSCHESVQERQDFAKITQIFIVYLDHDRVREGPHECCCASASGTIFPFVRVKNGRSQRRHRGTDGRHHDVSIPGGILHKSMRSIMWNNHQPGE